MLTFQSNKILWVAKKTDGLEIAVSRQKNRDAVQQRIASLFLISYLPHRVCRLVDHLLPIYHPVGDNIDHFNRDAAAG